MRAPLLSKHLIQNYRTSGWPLMPATCRYLHVEVLRCSSINALLNTKKQHESSYTLSLFKRFASTAQGTVGGAMNVFDRNTKRHQKEVASRIRDHALYDYIRTEVAERLVDRIADIARFFPKALDVGAGKGYIGRIVSKDEVGVLYQLDSSKGMLDLCPAVNIETVNVVGDEEILPFDDDMFDMIVSSLSMHWINDLPGLLIQIKNCLKEDGVFLGAMFGSDTLYQLRVALQLAETERQGGFAPRVSPFTEMRDIGSLLQRAGLNLTTIDYDDITIEYPSLFELLEDLKGMGESNAAWNRRSFIQRDTLFAAAAIYREMYGNEDGSIPATFRVLYMIGWKPSQSQPKPLARGSGEVSLKNLADVVHNSPNEKACKK